MNNQSAIHQGISVLVVSRNSGQHSTTARQLAARELLIATKELQSLTGQDLSSELPTEQAIVNKLRAAKREKSRTADGKSFTNEYVLEHLPINNAAVLVSTGTGVKLDETLTQPFLKHVAEVVDTLRPGLLFVHRLDRLFRHDLAPADLLTVLRETGCKFADGELGFQAPGSIGTLMTMIRSQGSAEEAKRIPLKTRAGMTARTGSSMSGEMVPYAAGVAPPPGLTVVRLRSDQGTKGHAALFFDRPLSLPEASTVAYGRPEVAINGQLVDQVAIVRTILATLGKPGHGIAEVARNAMKAGFSTYKLRNYHGMNAQWLDYASADSPSTATRAVIANLKFYETGIFTVRLGIDGVNDLVITDCFPDGRPWATPEDFARIRDYLNQTTGGTPATLGLVGVEVTTEHGIGYLRKAPSDVAPLGDAYILRSKRGQAKRWRLPPIPHRLLAESIVQGLVEKADSTWIPLELEQTPEIQTLQVQIVDAQRQLETLNAKADRLLESALNPAVNGELLADLNRKYDSLKSIEIATKVADIRRLEADRDQLAAEIADANRGVEDSILLELVASLREPGNTKWNDLWKKAVTLKISREQNVIHGHKGIRVAWEGVLRIVGAGHTFEAPFKGEFLNGAASQVETKVCQVIKNLENGIPYPEQVDITRRRELRAAVAKALGLKGKQQRLLTTADEKEVREILSQIRRRDPDSLKS